VHGKSPCLHSIQPHIPETECAALLFPGGEVLKLVYIASPLRGDYNQNIKNAVKYCKNACDMGVLAIAPHIVFSQWCNDTIPEQREQGLRLGLELLAKADELWVMGDRVSQGMAGEIAFAKEHGIPIFAVDNPHDLDLYPVSHDENPLLGAHSCLPDSKDGHFEGEIVVLRYDRLKPEYRTPLNQLWRATHGNGCRPNAIGRSVFLAHITDGDTMAASRHDICGVAKPEVLEQMKAFYPAMEAAAAGIGQDMDEGMDR